MTPDTQRYAYRLQIANELTALPRVVLYLSRRRIAPEYLEHTRGQGRGHSLLLLEIMVEANQAAIIGRQLERMEEVNVVEYSALAASDTWLAEAS
ncbi:MAG: hypothetical protein K0U93_24560 [Gammaproteobacteria bacterium]|nr:hypothetical protein [Gammaproteobacteria bacterium]